MAPTSIRVPAPLRTAALILAATGSLAACELGKDTATLELDSPTGTAIRLITSNDFAVGLVDGEQVFHLSEGDTTWVETPFAQDFDLRTTGMFYARAMASEDPEAEISMRVLIDGDESFFHQGVIQGEGPQFWYAGR